MKNHIYTLTKNWAASSDNVVISINKVCFILGQNKLIIANYFCFSAEFRWPLQEISEIRIFRLINWIMQNVIAFMIYFQSSKDNLPFKLDIFNIVLYILQIFKV